MKKKGVAIKALVCAVLVSSFGIILSVSNPFKTTYTFKNETPHRVVVTIKWLTQGTEDSLVSIAPGGQEQIGNYIDNIKRIEATIFTGPEPKGTIFTIVRDAAKEGGVKGAVKAIPFDEWVVGDATFRIFGPEHGYYWIMRARGK
jgi:hypothetical protein